MPGMIWLSHPLVVLLLVALLGAVLLGATVLFWRQAPARSKIPRAQKRREEALRRMAALAERLRQQEPELDPKPILELPLEKLVQKMLADELSLESVLCSYLEEALKAHQEVNCLTDFLDECEDQLQALKKLKKSERGLLYGVPISLKDTYDCMGHDSSCGLAQFLEKPAAKDGVIVKVLKAQGAIPFVKTNISQTLQSYDCSNPIYGQTLNPQNLKKTPGGSSGGEGALLAEGGSILGMGTDTGGSIRIPASFCGVCGIRVTGYRLSYSGVASAVKGRKAGITVAGPLARDVESLALCLRALLSEHMHRLDPTTPFLPFREQVYSSNRPLRIGYYESDGFTQPSPSMARAVKLTSRLLRDAGHQVIPFSVPRTEYAFFHLYQGTLFADGGATLLEKLQGDIVDPSMKNTVNSLRLPDSLKRFLAWIWKYIEPRVSQIFEMLCGVGTPKKLWELHQAVEEYQQEFIAKWRSLDLDVLLSPALDPAFYIGYPAKANTSISYLALYNLLNFPAGVVPVTTVTPQDEKELAFYKGYYRDSSDKNFLEVLLRAEEAWNSEIQGMSTLIKTGGGERICGAFGGCAVYRFAMGRGTVSPVYEGGGDLGQEPDGTQVTRHSSWRSFYILIQVCTQCSFLLKNTRSASFLLLLEAHQKFSLLSLCVAAEYTDFPDDPSMGSRVKGSINILTGWLHDLWSRWGGRAVDFLWPSTSSCSPPVQLLRCYPRLQ
ncbi:vitamin D3 hydroxylase-associated protein-like isoform X1 [Cervus elaphus]|uniref:vitamin D3 hydroxylase-associated protein-like isoform X1 n=1 Tax=Cervus elaphus TaxID=9860 RepID=UPI001CC2D0CD|nr:vitamin D3 hydroxylase-associated protein-like isoform X1 [Cervus elaphus]